MAEDNREVKRAAIAAVTVVVVIVLGIVWLTTNGFGLMDNDEKIDNGSTSQGPEKGDAQNNGYVPDAGSRGPDDLEPYKRKGVPPANFDGLDDTDPNAVILSFLSAVYNTTVAATDSPTNNSLRAKGLMTDKLAKGLEDSEKDQPASARWLNWGEHGVVLRAEFSLNQKDFPEKETHCPSASPTEKGKCIFLSGGEETASTGNSVQRIVLIRQWKSAGDIPIDTTRLVARVTAIRSDEGSWRVSALSTEALGQEDR